MENIVKNRKRSFLSRFSYSKELKLTKKHNYLHVGFQLNRFAIGFDISRNFLSIDLVFLWITWEHASFNGD